MRITIGTGTPSSCTAAMTPWREHVAAQDAAEDVDQHGLDVAVGHQDAEGVLDLLRVRAAADIQEVGRLAARQLDDVHRRHGEAGAVDHAADVAVEADVVERELRRFDFERILFGQVAQVAQIGMPIERVVVEDDLRVERQQIAALGQDQRVDLDHRRVGLDERLVDRVEQLHQLVGRARAEAHAERQLARLKRDDARARIDLLAQDLLGFLRRDLLDVHAAGGAGDDDRARRRAIDDDAQIELALDLEPFFDQDATDLRPSGPV